MRIAQALLAAGLPPGAIGYYPADHSSAAEILLRCDRSMLFGDATTLGPWRKDSRVQLHGPGWSKVLVGEDRIDEWESHLELIVTSVAGNGGRSCVNASGVWVPSRGREVARKLAERLARVRARPLDDPEARLAAFPQPEVAHAFSDYIDRQLAVPGAVDLTRELRGGERVVEVDGCSFVLPTLVWCEDPDHPLAACELLFPFASVVQVPQETLVDRMGATLVATAITGDAGLTASLIQARNVDRLNLGLLPTCRVPWDQPHEGNLFEHLYRQRAFQQQTGDPSASAA